MELNYLYDELSKGRNGINGFVGNIYVYAVFLKLVESQDEICVQGVMIIDGITYRCG